MMKWLPAAHHFIDKTSSVVGQESTYCYLRWPIKYAVCVICH